tara:strand:- start:104 stop:667 length:564 start_codon:yes stop_codon:yes gene_type:complete
MTKSADAFRTISEVAEWLETETHVLRFWESKFSQIKPVKRAGGRRYYRPKDMLIIGGIKKLLHEDGTTIKGAQRIIREKGLNYISSLSKPLEMVTVNLNDTKARLSSKNKASINQQVVTEQQSHSFAEVDGQFSMFSDEPMTGISKQVEPNYASISEFLCQMTVNKSNKVLFEKILLSIDNALKKRA